MDYQNLCTWSNLFSLLGKTGTMHIIKFIIETNDVSYNSIRREMPFLNQKTLANRLKELVEHWLINRINQNNTVRYIASEKLLHINEKIAEIVTIWKK
jgi:DNA-binding HxlR family transcriptional regulator